MIESIVIIMVMLAIFCIGMCCGVWIENRTMRRMKRWR